MNSKFSIIITTYNRSRLLVRALDSLIRQTEKNWEAIIIDDGSSDDTETVVTQFLNKNFNIQYFKQENQGEAAAKNKGVSLSSGEYVSFLDSDDEYAKNHLETRLQILEQHPEVDLLHGGVQILGDLYVPDKKNPDKMIHLTDCAIGGTFFIKREVFSKLGGFKDIQIGTDSDLFERVVLAGFKTLKTSEPTYIYNRTSSDSITHKFMKNSIKA